MMQTNHSCFPILQVGKLRPREGKKLDRDLPLVKDGTWTRTQEPRLPLECSGPRL